MITPEQGQQQFDAADRLEADVLKGRWRGITAEKLWLIECEQGIMIEVELGKRGHGQRLLGTPDVTDDGQYQLQMVDRSDRVISERLVTCDQLYAACCEMLDAAWN